MQQTTTLPNSSQQLILKNRQYEIPYLLYRFRFLTVYHLQRFLGHKYPSNVQGWLSNLQKEGYIYQFYERHTAEENTKPAIYCLTAKARQLLKDNPNCHVKGLSNLYREKKCSKAFRERWCFLTDIYFMLQELYKDSKAELHFSTKRKLYDYPFIPEPDIYLAITQKRKKTKRYFLEMFDVNTRRKVLRGRIRNYIHYAEYEWKNQTSEEFPAILLITLTDNAKNYLRRFILREQRKEFTNLNFYVTTKATLQTQGFTNEVWQKVET